MNNRNTTTSKLQTIRSIFQSDSRFGRETGSAFERNLKARTITEAYYTSMPSPRI